MPPGRALRPAPGGAASDVLQLLAQGVVHGLHITLDDHLTGVLGRADHALCACGLGCGLIHGGIAVHLEAEAGSTVVHLDNVPFAAEGFQEAGGHCLALGRAHAGRLGPAVLMVVIILASKVEAGHGYHGENDLERQRDRKECDDECDDDSSDPAVNIHSQKHTIIPPLGNDAAGASGRKPPGPSPGTTPY